MELSKDNLIEIERHQKEYDDKIHTLEDKIEHLEQIIKKYEGKKDHKSFQYLSSTIQTIVSLTSTVSSVIDNAYFIGKLVMPLYFYYKISK